MKCTQGRPETVLHPRQASVFTPPLHVTLKLALQVTVMFLVRALQLTLWQNNAKLFENIWDAEISKKRILCPTEGCALNGCLSGLLAGLALSEPELVQFHPRFICAVGSVKSNRSSKIRDQAKIVKQKRYQSLLWLASSTTVTFVNIVVEQNDRVWHWQNLSFYDLPVTGI